MVRCFFLEQDCRVFTTVEFFSLGSSMPVFIVLEVTISVIHNLGHYRLKPDGN
jgi:hypothetical protein